MKTRKKQEDRGARIFPTAWLLNAFAILLAIGLGMEPALAQSTPAPEIVSWSTAQQKMLEALRTIGDDAQLQPLAQRYEREIRATGETLREAQDALKSPQHDAAGLTALMSRLEQHQVSTDKLQSQVEAQFEAAMEDLRKEKELVTGAFERGDAAYSEMRANMLRILEIMGEMTKVGAASKSGM